MSESDRRYEQGLEPAAFKMIDDTGLHFVNAYEIAGTESESLLAASDIIRHFELNELINQLAIAQRGLQSLKDGGIDDIGRLDQRIEANQRLQRKIEDFRESSQEVED